IPIDPIFGQPIERVAVRRQYGLDPDKTTLLLSAGALGVSPTESVVTRLKELRHDVQTIVVCGRNEEVQQRVTEIVGEGNSRFHVLGYSERMHELMQISDLFIGKPGGLTTSEALACGLPMVIFSPIPGQEERNSDHLLEDGVAIKCNELTTIPFKIDRLLDQPERLDAMRRAARLFGRPDAAKTIVETLLDDQLPPLVLDDEQREAMTQAAAGETV
ncbi:MAG TPA: glycosyltransferase, partial [Chthoniobacteraceae bacterium]